MNTPNLSQITLPEFREFVGNHIFTIEFYKLPKKGETHGEFRRMNARLGVSKYVKGTDPVATEKRKVTNEGRMQLTCFEMVDVNEGGMKQEYRTLTLDPNRLVSLTANNVTLRNSRFEGLSTEDVINILDGFELGEDQPINATESVK